MRWEEERGGAGWRELSSRAKGHFWRFSPEGKSTANGVIINVWRFEFLNPTTRPSVLSPPTTAPVPHLHPSKYQKLNIYLKTVKHSKENCLYK